MSEIASDSTLAQQQENLERLNVGQLVRRWRLGLVYWNTERWGPDPNDAACLVPRHVLDWCDRHPLPREEASTGQMFG
jgi:hypothetical protein